MGEMRRGVVLALIGLLSVTLGAAGCRKPRKRAHTKEQLRQIEQAVLTEAPTPKIVVNAVLDNKIRLVGVDLDRGAVRPGGRFEVTYYWEALQDIPGEWKIFVHFEGKGKRSTHDHHPVGELMPISTWKKGQIIKDVQRITVGSDFPEMEARLYVGIFDEQAYRDRKQDRRMKVVNQGEAKVPVHKDGRIEAARVKISKSATASSGEVTAPPTPDRKPRTLTAYRTPEPPIIDGRLDDVAWRGIPSTRAFVAPGGEQLLPKQRTVARVTWDDAAIYVAFSSPDADIYNNQVGRDATLWKQDVVEVYLDPGADGLDYIELQVSPTGELFDAHFSSRRKPDWPTAAKRLTMPGLTAKVHAQGSVNVRDGKDDQRWTVEMAIPWADIPGVSAAAVGETWGMNLYRIEFGGAGGKGRFMGAWAPAGGDFHNVAEFGRVTFMDKTRFRPQPKPAAAGDAAAVPGARVDGAKAKTGTVAAQPATVAPKVAPPATVAPAAATPPKEALPTKTPPKRGGSIE